jgi:hypothetical protein
MRDTHPHNFTNGAFSRSWRYRAGALLVMLIAFGLMTIQPVVGQTQSMGKDIPAGLDMFKTSSAKFQFSDELTIPAGFFDDKSSSYAGAISFKGAPIGSFRDQKTGDADTIVERKSDAKFYGRQARATVPIELVALSLESDQPIRVQVGKEWQSWKVKVELSPSRKSEGTMTIMRRGKSGGTFNSEFVVYPLYTFTREGDGMQKRLDASEMKMSKKGIESMTLRATNVVWAENCSQRASAVLCAGVTIDNRPLIISHQNPRHSHRVVFAEISPIMQ